MIEARTFAVAALTAAVLAACASPGKLAPRSGGVSDPNTLVAGQSLAGTLMQGAWPAADWWHAFGDPQLDVLVAEALAGNPDLRLAQARLDGARAQTGAADAATQPKLLAEANASRQRFSEHDLVPPPFAGTVQSTGHGSLDFSWDLDFWGKNRAALQAALSREAAAGAEQAAARLLLATALTHVYVEFARLQEQREILEASLALRQDTERLTRMRVRAGLELETETRQAASSVAQVRGELAGLETAENLVRHQLAALAGAGPDRGLALVRPALQSAVALALPSELPAELVARRPDVAAARQRVEAALGATRAARAAFYPNLNLSAFAGVQALGFQNLFRAGSQVAGVSPAISLPIFDGGLLRAGLASRQAEFDAAVAEYDGAVLSAVRDVSDQVASWRGIDKQAQAQEQALRESRAARELAGRREGAGLATHLAVINAELRLQEQRRSLSDLAARRLDVAVQLNRALGGGFSPAPNL